MGAQRARRAANGRWGAGLAASWRWGLAAGTGRGNWERWWVLGGTGRTGGHGGNPHRLGALGVTGTAGRDRELLGGTGSPGRNWEILEGAGTLTDDWEVLGVTAMAERCWEHWELLGGTGSPRRNWRDLAVKRTSWETLGGTGRHWEIPRVTGESWIPRGSRGRTLGGTGSPYMLRALGTLGALGLVLGHVGGVEPSPALGGSQGLGGAGTPRSPPEPSGQRGEQSPRHGTQQPL